MTNYPLLSIVTSNLNSGSQLQKTIDWFQKNKPASVEYIVIDGASSDSSCDLIQSSPRVVDKFISEPDLGIYDAWNKGVGLAEGSYICFLGAGDVFDVESLSEFLQYIASNPDADFISGRAMIVDNQNNPIRLVGRAWKWSSFRRHSYVAHPGSFHSRRLFLQYGLYDIGYKVAGDYEFLLRSKKLLRAKFLNKTIVRMLEGGVSQVGYKAIYEEFEAKRKNQTILPFIAYYDLYKALAKQWVRNKLSKNLFEAELR